MTKKETFTSEENEDVETEEESEETTESEESEEEREEEEESEQSPITGEVVEDENKIEGQVSKDNDFVYELEEGKKADRIIWVKDGVLDTNKK